MTGRERTLAALHGQPVDHPPVWVMRQAGRYLPEYRALRAGMSFMELVHAPEACTEAALQPLRRFPLDATIVFSDILVLPDALGCGLQFVVGDGPSFTRPLVDPAELRWEGACARLPYVYEAVRQLRAAAPDHALFGFAGSPWTLFCYMAEGQGGGEFQKARVWLRRDPVGAQRVLDQLADLVAEHLLRQREAGADVVQVFDTWGGLLDRASWMRFCAPGLRHIASRVQPAMLFVRHGAHLLGDLGTLGYAGVSHDATMELRAGSRHATQGNLDNCALLGPIDAIAADVEAIDHAIGRRRNHVYNLGHGVLPGTPPEAVAAFVEAVHRLG